MPLGPGEATPAIVESTRIIRGANRLFAIEAPYAPRPRGALGLPPAA
jgi:hypothetical protein